MLDYCAALERQKLKEGIRLAMAVSADANKFITDTEPFRLLKTDKVGRPWPLRPAPPPPHVCLGRACHATGHWQRPCVGATCDGEQLG